MIDLAHVEGLLLDMDGTLVDSDAAVERTWRAWALANDVDPDAVAANCHGTTAQGTIRAFRPDYDDALVEAQAREHMRRESVDIDGVVANPGALDLITYLDDVGLPWAVVTNADRTLALARLGAGGITPAVLTSVEEVAVGKPDPAIYLLGAARLEVAPQRCLAVEDSAAGIAAARAAGIPVAALRRPDGDLEVADLTELVALMRRARA